MRLATVTSVVTIALSTAALAQVASSPVEQKTSIDNVAAADKTEGADNGTQIGTGNVADDAAGELAPTPAPTRTPRRR